MQYALHNLHADFVVEWVVVRKIIILNDSWEYLSFGTSIFSAILSYTHDARYFRSQWFESAYWQLPVLISTIRLSVIRYFQSNFTAKECIGIAEIFPCNFLNIYETLCLSAWNILCDSFRKLWYCIVARTCPSTN